MARVNWQDEIVEKPRTYRIINNADGTVTLEPEKGEVFQEGTPVNAANLNALGAELDEHQADEAPHVKNLGDTILNTDSGNDYPLGVSMHEVGAKNWGNGYPLNYGIVLSYKQRSLRFVQFMYGHSEPVTYTRVWYSGNWSEWTQVITEEMFDTHVADETVHRKITFGTSEPSGGSNGDIYLQYD